jgi:hypothetical protein
MQSNGSAASDIHAAAYDSSLAVQNATGISQNQSADKLAKRKTMTEDAAQRKNLEAEQT